MEHIDIKVVESVKKLLVSNQGPILLIPHENPDGDALGSATGFAIALKNAGHKVAVLSPNRYPDFLKLIEGPVEIMIFENNQKRAKKLLRESSLIICVDFNEIARAGVMEKILKSLTTKKILIDHHPDPDDFCDVIVSDSTCSSVAELCYHLLVRMDYRKFIDREAAEALYTGIMTDTGSFSYGISRPDTFRVLSGLIELGIDPDKIHREVYDNYSADRMRLLGFCLSEKMEILPEYRTSIIALSREELKRFNFKPGDTEGFVNYPLAINNIVFSALFMEKESMVKVSFRSKGDLAVNVFSARHFRGGGHKNAAGGESASTLNETIRQFKQLLPSFMHQLSTNDTDHSEILSK